MPSKKTTRDAPPKKPKALKAGVIMETFLFLLTSAKKPSDIDHQPLHLTYALAFKLYKKAILQAHPDKGGDNATATRVLIDGKDLLNHIKHYGIPGDDGHSDSKYIIMTWSKKAKEAGYSQAYYPRSPPKPGPPPEPREPYVRPKRRQPPAFTKYDPTRLYKAKYRKTPDGRWRCCFCHATRFTRTAIDVHMFVKHKVVPQEGQGSIDRWIRSHSF